MAPLQHDISTMDLPDSEVLFRASQYVNRRVRRPTAHPPPPVSPLEISYGATVSVRRVTREEKQLLTSVRACERANTVFVLRSPHPHQQQQQVSATRSILRQPASQAAFCTAATVLDCTVQQRRTHARTCILSCTTHDTIVGRPVVDHEATTTASDRTAAAAAKTWPRCSRRIGNLLRDHQQRHHCYYSDKVDGVSTTTAKEKSRTKAALVGLPALAVPPPWPCCLGAGRNHHRLCGSSMRRQQLPPFSSSAASIVTSGEQQLQGRIIVSNSTVIIYRNNNHKNTENPSVACRKR